MDFKTLQKMWYQRLKDDGFIDIENKEWHSRYFVTQYSPVQFANKQEYFRRAQIFLHEFPFKNRRDRKIWRLHSEGFTLREIAKKCRTTTDKMNKDNIHAIVLSFARIMNQCFLEGSIE